MSADISDVNACPRILHILVRAQVISCSINLHLLTFHLGSFVYEF